jgi:large subunit ribosomal protein L32
VSSNFTLQKSFVILLKLAKVTIFIKYIGLSPRSQWRKKEMAVPARRTSKAKKNKRRTHYKVTAPTVKFDETTGDYSRSHRVSLKGYYKGRKIEKAASAE